MIVVLFLVYGLLSFLIGLGYMGKKAEEENRFFCRASDTWDAMFVAVVWPVWVAIMVGERLAEGGA